MTARIFIKLLAGICLLIAMTLLAADLLGTRAAERYFVDHLRTELEDKSRVLLTSHDMAHLDNTKIRELAQAAGARITVVARDGRVLLDSEAEASSMENHSNRPELREAFGGAVGSITRKSPTLGVDFLYVAIPMSEGALRLAMPLSAVQQQVSAIRFRILQGVAIAFIPAVLLAAFLSRRIAGRLSEITNYAAELAKANFEARLKTEGNGELSLLARELSETGARMQKVISQLQTEQVEMEKLERIRKDFVINVSHELRTPLASIQGYTETLMDGAIDDSDNNIRFLGIIRNNAERLTRLTADLLTLSRLELRTQELRFASWRVDHLLADVVDTVRPIAMKRNINIFYEGGPEGHEVFCDREAFYQIVSNLLDNAVKYTGEGGKITAGWKPLVKAGSLWIEFFVRDSGMGIPPEDQPRLFERFYRVDKARSRELGGTGLGLAIVKHLVIAHAGEVRVESQAGMGSTFFFTLPVDHADIPAESPSLGVHNALTAL
jgi:two-component system phosphate regulon sensor histidine kinase PhoR